MNGLNALPVPNAGLSLGADIYRQYRKGELTLADYYVFTAGMVASIAHEEVPRSYPPFAQSLKQYVDRRLQGSEPDSHLSHLLGTWIMTAYRALDHNHHVMEHLAWCRSKCASVKLSRETDLLDRASARFNAVIFPQLDFQKALDVQRMDSDARQRKRND